MANKKTKSPDEKFESVDFDLFAALDALDRKDYGWFSRLTDEQAKKFVPYMMLHWMSSVKGSGLLPAYYVLSVDATANRHMFNENIVKHPALQWMMLCTASPGSGKQWHQWIPHLSAAVSQNRERAKVTDVEAYLTKIFGGGDTESIKSAAEEWTKIQNHRYNLSKICPTLKPADIEALSKIVSEVELDEYEKRSGN